VADRRWRLRGTWRGARAACVLAVAVSCGGGGSSASPAATAIPAPTLAATTATPSPQPTPSASPTGAPAATRASAAPTVAVPRGWVLSQASGGGRVTGRHCGGILGDWVIDGTYDLQGQKGVQKWTITVDLSSIVNPSTQALGDYTYTDNAVLSGLIPVTLEGSAKGDVEVTVEASGRALMHLTETAHSFHTVAPGGGRGQDQNAPLQASVVTWEVDPTCP